MTAKQYYKQTSDMAYHLGNVMTEVESDKVIANIALIKGDYADAVKILDENDFFSIPPEIDLSEIDMENIQLEIRFHYGIDNLDIFELNVCDVIDCTVVDGGSVVLSCNGYERTKSYRPRIEKDEEKETVQNAPAPKKTIFDLFDDFAGWRIPDWSHTHFFPSIPDWTKTFEDAEKKMKETIESAKNCKDGDSKFYNFSCKIDPDGKVHIKRSSNDGTVEKEFMLGDKSSASDPKKIAAEDAKTELRNLVK